MHINYSHIVNTEVMEDMVPTVSDTLWSSTVIAMESGYFSSLLSKELKEDTTKVVEVHVHVHDVY